jgi:hypothetical protein
MPGSPYKKALFSVLLTLMLSVFWQAAPAQTYGSDYHTVTVTVATITDIQVSSGSVSLTITGAGVPAGQDQMTAVDQTTNLLWGVNSATKKVTVNTNLVAPLFTMKLLALTPTSPGTAAPEVTLSTTPTDLLLNIGRSTGTCSLRYTGIALASQGMGTDTHTITFTVATQ